MRATKGRMRWLGTIVAGVWIAMLQSALPASAQDVVVKIIDTGRGGFDENCLPGFEPPFCPRVETAISSQQFLAAQFILEQPTTLDSVKLWASLVDGGGITVRIYSDVNGLPGNRIHSQFFGVPDRLVCQDPSCIDWLTFQNFTYTLAAGTYWLAFEPEPGMTANLPIGAPEPLPRYASFYDPGDGTGFAWRRLHCVFDVFDLDFPAGGCGGDPQYIDFGSVGIQIFATTHSVTSGTAARGILQGRQNGTPIFPQDIFKGGFGKDADAPAYKPGVGASTASARISGTFSAHVFGWTAGPGLTEATGASRAVVFGEWRNDTEEPLDVSANAILQGLVFPGLQYGHVTAAVYIFDKDQFYATIDNVTAPLEVFLLGVGDTLPSFAAVDTTNFQSTFSISRKFPEQALKAQAFHIERLSVDSTLSIVVVPVKTPLTQIDPGASVVIMLDASHYQPPGGSIVSFYDSLKPAPVFLTDASGNPSPLTPVGTSLPAPPAPANVALSPVTTISQIGTPVPITATVTGASGEAVRDTAVYFQVTTGPNAHPPIPIMTDAEGRATFSYTGGPGVGTDEIRANIGTLQSNVAQVAWTSPGPLDHISISPTTATIAAGASQTYSALALDFFDNSIGDVTAGTTFTISPDGSCTGATCTPSLAGPHTVTATYDGKIATAELNVTAAVLDHITIGPASATIVAGGTQSYVAEAFDASNGSLGDVTSQTTFTISPDGSCSGATCTASVSGPHTVTATHNGKTATATLNVSAGPLDHITISPASATIAAGGSQTYTTHAFDAFNNAIGSVTSQSTFTISPDGSCGGATCSASVPGTHTVTATHNGKTATATLEVTAVSSSFAFQGFFAPIDMSAPGVIVWNTVKAGQTVPVKWLLTRDGTPVADPASFLGLSSYEVSCDAGFGSIEQAIEQTASGSSGLQYIGGGYWQYNWKTHPSFKNTCRAVVVRFSDGTSSPPAMFLFLK